jgi:hypothetical protein
VLENVVSNAERRALKAGETWPFRASWIFTPPALHHRQAGAGIRRRTEGRRQCRARADQTGRRQGVHQPFRRRKCSQIVQWFELGGSLKLDETVDSSAMAQQLGNIQGLMEKTGALGLGRASRTHCAPQPPSSSWKACTRIAASAATRKLVSPPASASANRGRRAGRGTDAPAQTTV